MKKNLILNISLIIIPIFYVNAQTNKLTYRNINILSDLSSRLINKPTKDIIKIKTIIDEFKNENVKPGKKIGDCSSIYFSTFSKSNIASIDLERHTTTFEKQQFINGTGKFKNKGLDFELKLFELKVQNTYKFDRNNGIDLISVLVEKIKNELIIKEKKVVGSDNNRVIILYVNDIYIFTDGYLEFQNKNINNQFYFGDLEIKRLRNYCKIKKINIIKALDQNPKLGLPPVNLLKNRLINLHIWETHQRDFNYTLQTFKNPIGLHDNEILEAVWRKWAKESGFRSFEWRTYY